MKYGKPGVKVPDCAAAVKAGIPQVEVNGVFTSYPKNQASSQSCGKSILLLRQKATWNGL